MIIETNANIKTALPLKGQGAQKSNSNLKDTDMNTQTHIAVPSTDEAITYADLSDLYLHELNPRQEVTEDEIVLLSESIRTCGLIQNLSGIADDSGKIGIVAGGRRLRALQHLAGQGVAVSAIPVKLAADKAEAALWANAENTARAELDPADEVRAYGKMAKAGRSVSEIAAAFAVSEAHVSRRLKLAHLPETVLVALKARKISLVAAKAFTICNDEARILEALQMIEGQSVSEHRLKEFLQPDAVRNTDRRAVFVGLEAYERAGGRITRDLFSEDVFLEDADLLNDLFTEKLNAEAEKIRIDGWSWAETTEASYLSWYELSEAKLERLYPVEGYLSDEEIEEYDDLSDLANGDALDEAGEVRLDALQTILNGDFSEDQKAVAGGYAYVNQQGQLKTELGLVRPEDRKAAYEADVLQEPQKGRGGDKPKSPFSKVLSEDMTAIRLASVQSALLAKPEFLLDLLGFHLSSDSGPFTRLFDLSLGNPRNTPSKDSGFEPDERIANPDVNFDKPDGEVADAFKAFRDQGKKTRNAEITEAFARVLNYDASDIFQLVEEETGAAIRKVWTPNAENFFSRVSADYLNTLFCDLLEKPQSDEAFKRFKAMKKAEKTIVMEKLFSEPEYQDVWQLTQDQKAKIADWIPGCF